MPVSRLANAIAPAASRVPAAKVDTSLLLNDLVTRYSEANSPIHVDFRAITPWIKGGDQFTHHIHPYPGKVLPNIAGFFLSASILAPRGGIVLDPFCGSGTVALEASLGGFHPLVADVNPLAILITSAKTTAHDAFVLLDLLRRIVSTARRFKTAPEVDVVNANLWYTKKRKAELERILRSILQIAPADSLPFFQVCFSVLARRLSNADPAISVPVRLKEKEGLSNQANSIVRKRLKWVRGVDSILEFERICIENIERVHSTNGAAPDRVAATSAGNSAQKLYASPGKPLPSNSVSLVLTSPPYGSAQKYIRASSLSLNWLGLASPESLKSLEQASIGREHVPSKFDQPSGELSPKFEDVLSRIKAVNSIRAVITRAYLNELKAATDESYRVLKPGGRMILVIGNNSVCGTVVQNDEFVRQHLEFKGAKTELALTDNIKTRALMRKRNATAALIQKETILMLRKPLERSKV